MSLHRPRCSGERPWRASRSALLRDDMSTPTSCLDMGTSFQPFWCAPPSADPQLGCSQSPQFPGFPLDADAFRLRGKHLSALLLLQLCVGQVQLVIRGVMPTPSSIAESPLTVMSLVPVLGILSPHKNAGSCPTWDLERGAWENCFLCYLFT